MSLINHFFYAYNLESINLEDFYVNNHFIVFWKMLPKLTCILFPIFRAGGVIFYDIKASFKELIGNYAFILAERRCLLLLSVMWFSPSILLNTMLFVLFHCHVA